MKLRFILLLLLFLLLACDQTQKPESAPQPETAAPEAPAAKESNASILQDILARGEIRCGIQGELPGFGYKQDDEYSGLDIDICRALGAAVFGDARKVAFVELTSQDRFEAVIARQVDVLVRNTTWTLTRDTELGLDFGPVVFYDGQGVMVKRESGIFMLADLADRKICVQPATTSQSNIEDTLKSFGVNYELVSVTDPAIEMQTLIEGGCDAVTGDRSALIALKASSDNPADFSILDVVISQEPLAPAFLENDPQWGNIVRWTIFGMMHAERLGITAENIESFYGSGSPEAELLLGESGDLGRKLGLDNNFVADVVSQVGNFKEVYDRNLGVDSPIGLARGQNALWTSGGLMYAPPFR